MKNSKLNLTLKIVLALFLGASTVMTILGAVGTACLAWSGQLYGPAFKWIVPAMPLYQVMVYVSLVAGVGLAIVTYAFLRGDKWFYVGSLIFLAVGGGMAAYQMYMTSSLKGVSFFQTAPTNIRFYITVATLIAFIVVRFPGIWNQSGLGGKSSGGSFTAPTGMALMVTGILLMTAPMWASPEHVIDGFNYVTTLQVPLLIDGLALTIAGAVIFFARRLLALAKVKMPVVASK